METCSRIIHFTTSDTQGNLLASRKSRLWAKDVKNSGEQTVTVGEDGDRVLAIVATWLAWRSKRRKRQRNAVEKTRQRRGGRTKEGGTKKGRPWRTRDRRPSVSQSLLGSLFGLAFPFLSRTKATLFRPYVHMDAGRKYSPLFSAPAARIQPKKQAADRHTCRTCTHVCQKQQPTSPTIVSIVRLAYNPFSYVQCSSPTRYPFVAVYSSIGPRVFLSRRALFQLNSVSSNWTVERIVCWSGNRAFREFAGLFRVFLRSPAGLSGGFASNVDAERERVSHVGIDISA